MSKALNHLLALLVAAFFLAACAPQPPVPEDNFYRLPRATLTPVTKPLTEKLSVSHFVTDGLHTERALLYTEATNPLQLRQYHYHHWLDSPPRMLQEHLISALRTANIAQTVVNYDPGMRDSLRLGGKIRSFEHLRQGDKATIIINLELRLEDSRGKLLFLKDYGVEQPASSALPRDLVQTYGAALQVLYSEFITDWAASQ